MNIFIILTYYIRHTTHTDTHTRTRFMRAGVGEAQKSIFKKINIYQTNHKNHKYHTLNLAKAKESRITHREEKIEREREK